MDASLASEAIYRGGGQIIPTSRRACYSSFLMASPRLMEPLYACSMTGPADSVSALYTVLSKRRGHVLYDGPIAGTREYPFFSFACPQSPPSYFSALETVTLQHVHRGCIEDAGPNAGIIPYLLRPVTENVSFLSVFVTSEHDHLTSLRLLACNSLG